MVRRLIRSTANVAKTTPLMYRTAPSLTSSTPFLQSGRCGCAAVFVYVICSGQWLSQSQAEQKSMVFMTDNMEPRQAVISPLKRDDFVLEMTWVEEDVSSKARAVRGCLQTMEGFALYLRCEPLFYALFIPVPRSRHLHSGT